MKTKKILTLKEMAEATRKRVEYIAKEFTDGFDLIQNYPKSVTFFGSARTDENDLYYKKAENLAKRIVNELHYSVVSGGGPGIMQGANKGAFEAGGNSVGLTIDLPHEQSSNQYMTDSVNFHYFFSRKVCLAFSAEAYLFFPGGFGTLDEFTEILTLQQTQKIPKAPIILVGEEYWNNLESFFKNQILDKGMIQKKDIEIYKITDDEDEIINIIKNAPIRNSLTFDPGEEREDETILGVGPITELSKRHCTPCEEGDGAIKYSELPEFLRQVEGWTLEEDKKIEKVYHFENFNKAISFINKIASVSEKENHHPNIYLFNYKNVKIELETHSINGLSENDFILASKIDGLDTK